MTKSSTEMPRHEFSAIFPLPDELQLNIGGIVTAWAAYESSVQNLVFMAAGVSPRVGRIAIRAPRVVDRLDTISDLLAIRGIFVDKKEMLEIRKESERLSSERDLVAHGVWGTSDGKFYVQDLRRAWDKGQWAGDTLKKRAFPEMKHITPEFLKGIGGAIVNLWKVRFREFYETTGLHTVQHEGPLPQSR